MLAFLFNSLEKIPEPLEDAPSKITARIDIQLRPKTADGDFQIVSISDKQAEVKKPAWFQKGGIGYQIQSANGTMKIVAKATADGQIKLSLRGLDVRDSNNKCIPYWVDYTRLIVNGKSILDNVTSAWLNMPYNYQLKVKAGEEIKIETAWLLQKDDTPTETATQVKTEPVVSKLLPYITAKLDVKLTTAEDGGFQIISISDKQADVSKPEFLQNNGVGYQIQSYNGSIKLVVKANVDGQLSLKLSGSDIRKDNSQLIHCRIDYTNLKVNGKKIFNEITTAWHYKPYDYTMDVKAGEEIKIQTAWLPRRIDT